jgi:phage N-6-adenine-methyltransferase
MVSEGLAAMHSSASVEWATPQELFDTLNTEFGFTLDAAAAAWNAKCSRYFTKETDGLAQDWSKDIVWLNPPYGREIAAWMRKAAEEAGRGATVVCLVPARTDTAWWWESVVPFAEVRFLRGRVKFLTEMGGQQAAAPFPSAVIVYRPR